METTHVLTITRELAIRENQVAATAELLNQGATIPFIARYRKEVTDSLDEVVITAIRDRLKQLEELDARRVSILNSMEQQGVLTDDLKAAVTAAQTLAILEDIYLPFKPKRRTRGAIAREKGLAPLAERIWLQDGCDPASVAAEYVNPEKGVETVAEALAGARDIIAEIINEDGEARARLRHLFNTKGMIRSVVATGKEADGAKFKDYFDWEEPAAAAPSHRILAMRRGENEDMLNLSMAPPEEMAVNILESLFLKGDGEDSREVGEAIHDCYKRLLSRSMETELRLATKEKADTEAIRVFADNLRQLLLSPPLGAKRVMGIDPGFRTGCKVVCLDRQGKLLHNDTFFPHTSDKQVAAARQTLPSLCERFDIEAIAVGNGTAGRETEAFIRDCALPRPIPVIMVNESGASIYSASEAARKEFPDHDLTVRGAVSIGRRLMDPLSELVKIDPKSIGVGQYQHDVDQAALKQALDDVVISCVNSVGVDVNRASSQLLTYVSGLGPQLAQNIVNHRDENGPFVSRKKLREVSRLGPKAFEQCAGFLRIQNGENPLDASAVHPESYPLVDAMARDLECTISDLLSSADLRSRIDLNTYVSDAVGLPTLTDILKELAKPGRDPRQSFEIFEFADGINKIGDLEAGMKLPGIVTNVTAFGAFVDIGVHQDGLVHVSELADRFVKDPAQVVKVQQKVMVTVMEVDEARKRISLSMKSVPGEAAPRRNPAENAPRTGKGPRTEKVRQKNEPFNNPFAALRDKNIRK
ncbi:MAG: Tex family protein [Pseudomonadota bacterium]